MLASWTCLRRDKRKHHVLNENAWDLLCNYGNPHFHFLMPGGGSDGTPYADIFTARWTLALPLATDLRLGKAAFAEAVRLCPELRITLRHKTRVIEEHQK